MRTDGNITAWSDKDIIETIEKGYDENEYKHHHIEYDGFGSVRGKLLLQEEIFQLCTKHYTHIIRIDNEPFTAYFDVSKRKFYINPDIRLNDEYPQYKGLSNRTINKLTAHTHMSNYVVRNEYYDYEDSCLVIQETSSNIDPQSLTDNEMQFLSERVEEYINKDIKDIKERLERLENNRIFIGLKPFDENMENELNGIRTRFEGGEHNGWDEKNY